MAWRRRWHGDEWRKVWVEDVEGREEAGGSDFGWGDGSEDIQETWVDVEDGIFSH